MAPDTLSIAGYEVYDEQTVSEYRGSARTKAKVPHPLDQLSVVEVVVASEIVKEHFNHVRMKFNTITLKEPSKCEYLSYRDDGGRLPVRQAFVIALLNGSCHVNELLVSLSAKKVVSCRTLTDVMPILTLEDLDICERVSRADPLVLETCREIGIDDINEVYFDGWAIGVDERFGFDRRLQQGLAYWRGSSDDNQYAHPLDFTVVIDTEREEVLRIDIRKFSGERVAVPKNKHNFLPRFIRDGYIKDRLKPLEITQPDGVSFTMDGHILSWAGFHMHVGFNYREGIVLSDICVDDMHEKRRRTIFHRLSVAEMLVPYGNPDTPHHRKHAFDIGEYGMGFMTNSLKAGCDCIGAIKYLDAVICTGAGGAAVVPNAVCIHHEDNGILYKHTDYRDGTTHFFCLRVDPAIDGERNSVIQKDAVPSDISVGQTGNLYGNAFYCKKTTLKLSQDAACDYDHTTSRTWDIVNPNRLNPASGQPVAYSIISREPPNLLCKPGGLIWRRAGFARHALWVTRYKDDERYAAGDYVCQSTGQPGWPANATIVDWTARNESIENEDIVYRVQFGITHFPRTEDFPSCLPSHLASCSERAISSREIQHCGYPQRVS